MNGGSLAGQVALVTGAATGIGLATAEALAAHGAVVAAHCHPDQQGEFPADLVIDSEITALFNAVLSRFGRLDILVNNAACDPGAVSLFDVSPEFYDSVMDVNLKAVFFCSQHAARIMLRQGGPGRIVNIGSVHAQATVPRHTVYAASKGGLEALTRSMALELAPHGVTVNAVAPGFIEVARTIGQTEGYSRESVGATIPVGRVGMPEDVTALIAFLCGPSAAFITGQVCKVDGGLVCRLAR
jgi:NAD(P)-dependent dehydrogenase (short-subunit alcohol dehydrogenase family)